MSTGVELIAEERQRQVEHLGYTPEHDEEHTPGLLAVAGAVYALPSGIRNQSILASNLREALWPRAWEFKGNPHPGDYAYPHWREARVRELAKAGALIAAEMDSLIALGDEEL